VIGNLLVVAYSITPKRKILKNIDSVFELSLILKEGKDKNAGTLSSGEQQLLNVAKGSMAFPKVLMLDELSLGASPKTGQVVFYLIKEINQKKALAFYVSNKM